MPSLELLVEPRVVKTWEQFCAEAPPYSIALDGYVQGPVRYDCKGPRLNLNHHEGIDRTSTLSTCGQTYNYIKAGLFTRFQQEGMPTAKIYINDPDQDTGLAVWLLQNHDRIEKYKDEPLLNRLLFAQNQLDIFAGAYPFDPTSELMLDLFWIFEPYATQRAAVSEMDAASMRSIVESIGSRINAYTLSKGKKLGVKVEEHYKSLHQGTGWFLVEEKGPYARTGLYHANILAFITYRGAAADSRHHYSLGRISPFVDFPLPQLYKELNRQEDIPAKATDCWGGSDIAGGSPRQAGSSFSPEQLFAIVEKIVKNHPS